MDIQDYGDCKGIKLMIHTMKMWEKVIEKRLKKETTKEKWGFMPRRSVMEPLFCVKQLIERKKTGNSINRFRKGV